MKSALPIFLFILLILAACSPVADSTFRSAEQGILNLQGWDATEQPPVELNGEWEFYWQQLLNPLQILALGADPQYQEVPARWTSYGDEYSVEGYATFRLQVETAAAGVFGLLLDGQGSSSRLWVNGQIVAVDGDVGTELGTVIRSGKPQTVYFESGTADIEFVLQVSNFSHRNAGFRNPILLGSAEAIAAHYQQTSTLQWVYLSLLLALAMYHYYMFSQRRSETFSYHFANLCLLTAIRIGFTGDNVLVSVVPYINWEIALRLEYLTFFFVAPVFAAMMRSIYPEDVHRWFVRSAQFIAAAYSLYVILASTLAATYAVPSYQIVLLIEMVYFVYFLVRLFRFSREGRYYIGLATAVGLLGLLSEILFFRGILHLGATAPVGIVGFVFVQAIYMAARYSASYRRVEVLTGILEQNIRELEESEIKYRTIFEDSRDVIFIADLSGRILEISPACKNLFGFTPEAVKSNAINIYAISNKEDRSRFARLMEQNGAVEALEFELQHPDGRKVRAVLSASTRTDAEGSIIGIQGVVRDITDKVQALEQRRRADKLELIAATDALTGTYTRRYFDDVAVREMARSARRKTPLALVIYDIDYFKQINDTHGHLAGDKILVTLSNLCIENIRSTDVYCRFGGEEFIILMPETELESALQKIEALRDRVARKPLIKFNGEDIAVTFSAGVVAWNVKESIEDLIGRADTALYQAKEGGRNRSISGA